MTPVSGATRSNTPHRPPRRSERAKGSPVLGAVIAIVAVLAALLGLGSLTDDPSTGASDGQPSESAAAQTTTSTRATVAPTTADPAGTAPVTTGSTTAPSGDPSWQTELATIPIAPEGSHDGYDRDRFHHWIDADGDGCNTRCEVLERQRTTSLPGLGAGGWLSIYDGYSTDDPSELDVDHVVALSEAWRSGASGWDDGRREAFANDLDSGQLIAVTAATNRSKGDRDPADWQPPNRSAWCEYGAAWIDVKAKWGLTADQPEVTALTNMMAGCP